MRPPITVYQRNGWTLASQGNGAFYTLSREGRSVFFQGDDAEEFRARTMDKDGFLNDDCESAFADYSDVMQPD